MSLLRAREFLLSAYHDLPNVIFVGSLVLGSLAGSLPLVWLSMGLILNGSIVSLVQGILALCFPTWAQVAVPRGSYSCEILPTDVQNGNGTTIVAPSHWLAAAVFFAAFSIYNSIRVGMKPPAEGTPAEKVDTRRAFSLSVLVVGVVFFGLVLARGFTGCETWLGSTLGVLIGGGTAIGYWHMLDACGTGIVPDILQVVGSMAPSAKGDNTPIVCAPPSPSS